MLKDEDINVQKAGNSRIFELLQDCGSNLDEPHVMEHFFYAPSPAVAQAMAAEAKAAGYETTDVVPSAWDGKEQWHFLVLTPILPSEDAMNDQSIFMLSLAEKHGATYDGWGTLMMGEDVELPDELEEIDLDL